jgi:plastocyanin
MAGTLFGVLVLAVAGCGESKSAGGHTGTGSRVRIAGLEANDHGTKQVGEEAVLTLHDYYFSPTVIEAKFGSKVTLELRNAGQVEHNFSVPAQGISKNLAPGEDAEVTVRIPVGGAVSFFCSFHKSEGMAGALEPSGGGMPGGSGGGGPATDMSNGSGGGY